MTWLLPLLLLGSPSALAGNDYLVSVAQEAYEEEDYDKAIEKLDQALAEPIDLKEKTLPAAYYWLGMSHMKRTESIEDPNEQLEAIDKAVDAFMKGRKADLKLKYTAKIDKIFRDQARILLGTASQRLNTVKALEAEEATQSLNTALRWTNAVILGVPESPMALDVRSRIKEELGDTEGAFADTLKAIEVFENSPQATPDLYIGYVGYRAAYAKRQAEAYTEAVGYVDKGLSMLDKEFDRIEAPTAEQKDLHLKIKKDLYRLRFDVLLASPDLQDQAEGALEGADLPGPELADLWVLLGQMQEQVNVDKALSSYAKALALHADNVTAQYNSGQIHYARGAFLLEGDRKNQDGLESMNKALPFMEKTAELEPDHINALTALVTAHTLLGNKEKAATYKTQLERFE